jgi:hypothetical protein
VPAGTRDAGAIAAGAIAVGVMATGAIAAPGGASVPVHEGAATHG